MSTHQSCPSDGTHTGPSPSRQRAAVNGTKPVTMPGLVRARQSENLLGQVGEDELVGDRGDALNARLAPVALDVVLAGVAVAAVELHGAVGRLEGPGRRQQLRLVGLLGTGHVVVVQPGRLAD